MPLETVQYFLEVPMCQNKRKWPCTLLLALCILVPQVASGMDLSTAQTALRIAREEMKAAEAQRDVDARRVTETEKEMADLKKRLEDAQKMAAQSAQRYREAKQRHDEAQANLEKAWRR
jgi:septal ring factor EnvC (AmiA/AmiB activator)